MKNMVCPNCGRNYSDDLLYCLDDGARLERREEPEIETVVVHPRIVIDTNTPADQEYCPSCGATNKAGSRFCKKCGQPMTDDIPAPPVDPVPMYPDPVVVEPRKSYVGLIVAVFCIVGFLFLAIVIGFLAYNSGASSNTAIVNTNAAANTPTATPKPKTPTPSPTTDESNINALTTSRIGKTGTLTTDTNLRAEARPTSEKVGTQYKGARVKVLEVEEVANDDGGTSIWYHVVVTSYGRSTDPTNAGLDKDPGSADEGWLNSNPKVYDQSKKTQVHKRTVDFGDKN